ncbi:hypothetical protein [Halomarina oriensis]|uniref:Uncharacterized protein n=1 Tax=Halomarina oriensis TaxID=671145 RepID=A0A6B0GJ36_9EURY|nr:hypothetical protein [Halomarina oriensis]MWG34784.1 hypothetical protein [Halomarina oriensis]
MRLYLSAGERRLVRVTLAVFGLAHLLAPGLLIRGARFAYDHGLDVRFVAHEGTTRRVRLVGLCLVVAAATWHRLARL